MENITIIIIFVIKMGNPLTPDEQEAVNRLKTVCAIVDSVKTRAKYDLYKKLQVEHKELGIKIKPQKGSKTQFMVCQEL
jgi:hypothetical protein